MGKNIDKMYPDFDYFRENLKSLTRSKGLLNKDLAAEIGTTPATISRYMTNNRDPEFINIYRIARYFGVTIDFLLGINDDKNTGFTMDARRVAKLYMRASDADQLVVRTLLKKYEEMEP